MSALNDLNLQYVESKNNEVIAGGAILECSKVWSEEQLEKWLLGYDFNMIAVIKGWLENNAEIAKGRFLKVWVDSEDWLIRGITKQKKVNIVNKYTFMVNGYNILNVQANSMAEAEINLYKLSGGAINYCLLAVNRNLYKVEGGRFVAYNVGEEPPHLTGTQLN